MNVLKAFYSVIMILLPFAFVPLPISPIPSFYIFFIPVANPPPTDNIILHNICTEKRINKNAW